MNAFVHKLREWWQAAPRMAARHPFEVTCACGHRVQGNRAIHHQAVPCSGCGRSLFVLPVSPYPLVQEGGTQPVLQRPLVARAPWSLRRWLRHLVVATVVILTGVAIWARQALREPPGAAALEEAQQLYRNHVKAARQNMTEGSFHSALQDLQKATWVIARHPNVATSFEHRDLFQLQRQAELLADLMTESLEETLQRLDGLPEMEGQAVFERLYRRKALVFLTHLRRAASGKYISTYRLFTGNEEAALGWEDLDILRQLPLEEPQLVLIGARLAGFERMPAGKLRVAFIPESGVLMTHPGAAHACCFHPLDEVEFQQMLDLQSDWVQRTP